MSTPEELGEERILNMMNREPVVAGDVVDDLAEALREAILSGAIATGTWLRQERLAAEHGTSRTPVREALRSLQAQGIVKVVPNRGALVCGPTLREIREGYAVRAELEGYAAELAAELGSDDQIDRILETEALFRRAVRDATKRDRPAAGFAAERPRWSVANDLFHQAVIDAAGNQRLAETIRSLHRTFARNLSWLALSGNSHLLQENVKRHQEIARSIKARSPGEARTAMAMHVQRSGELVALRFEQQAPEQVQDGRRA